MAECDSTQDLARELLERDGALRIATVRAQRQRAGRGRDGRRWLNPPGPALLMSVAVRDPAVPGGITELPLMLRDAVVGAGREVLPPPERERLVGAGPNDLLLDGEKVGGVLVDVRSVGERIATIVAGIGINVGGGRWPADDRAATALDVVLAPPADDVSREAVGSTAPGSWSTAAVAELVDQLAARVEMVVAGLLDPPAAALLATTTAPVTHHERA